jgi:hypothetical protein
MLWSKLCSPFMLFYVFFILSFFSVSLQLLFAMKMRRKKTFAPLFSPLSFTKCEEKWAFIIIIKTHKQSFLLFLSPREWRKFHFQHKKNTCWNKYLLKAEVKLKFFFSLMESFNVIRRKLNGWSWREWKSFYDNFKMKPF